MRRRTIELSTELPTSTERVWNAMQHTATFLYVCRGLVGFPALAGRTEPLSEGETGRGWLFAFNVIPAYRHTIEVLEVDDETRTIRTHEFGGVLKRWDHTLHVEPIEVNGPEVNGPNGADEANRCRYSDTIVIEAGLLTPIAALMAKGIFTYRQRRWRRLVDRQLLPDGPAYGIRR